MITMTVSRHAGSKMRGFTSVNLMRNKLSKISWVPVRAHDCCITGKSTLGHRKNQNLKGIKQPLRSAQVLTKNFCRVQSAIIHRIWIFMVIPIFIAPTQQWYKRTEIQKVYTRSHARGMLVHRGRPKRATSIANSTRRDDNDARAHAIHALYYIMMCIADVVCITYIFSSCISVNKRSGGEKGEWFPRWDFFFFIFIRNKSVNSHNNKSFDRLWVVWTGSFFEGSCNLSKHKM